MNELDIGILLFVVVHLVLGIVRGFVWQGTRLVGLFGGLWLAGRACHPFGAFLRANVYDFPGKTDVIAAYVLLFLGIFVVFSILTHYLRGAIVKLKLKSFDRSMGGFLGTVKGCVYVFLLLLVFQWIFVPEPTEARVVSPLGSVSLTEQNRSSSNTGILGRLQSNMEDQFKTSELVPRIDALALYLKKLFPQSWVGKWNELIEMVQNTADRLKSPDLDLAEPKVEPQS